MGVAGMGRDHWGRRGREGPVGVDRGAGWEARREAGVGWMWTVSRSRGQQTSPQAGHGGCPRALQRGGGHVPSSGLSIS